jgi:tetratricopeptide (TPR) repeat protein
MNEAQKRYIVENIRKKSIAAVSRELGLKEKLVRDFLKRADGESKETVRSEETAHRPRNKFNLLPVFLIVIAGAIVYANSLHGAFIWDDNTLVKDNAYVKSWSRLPELFTKKMGPSYGFYRPLQMATYTMDYFLWRLNPIGYHLTNIFLHILTALAIWRLITILSCDGLLASLAALLFVVHPIQAEAVSYISGRADPLAAMFMFACFAFYIKCRASPGIRTYLLMTVSYVAALLSRENSLILPALIALYHCAFKKELRAREFLPLLGIACVYAILRATVLRWSMSSAPCSTTLLARVPGFFVAIANYARLLIFPADLHMEYGNTVFRFTDPRAIAGMAITLSLAVYALRRMKTNGIIFFSIAWFFVALLPVSNLYPLNAYMAEHWLYVPSIGFFLISAKGLSSLYRKRALKTIAAVLTSALLIVYSYLTIMQNGYWREPVRFYERTLRFSDSPRACINLGNAYAAGGNKERALEVYRKALGLNPSDSDKASVYVNLGNVSRSLGDNEEAIASYRKAIELNPRDESAYNNLGYVYNAIGKRDEAATLYKKAIGLNPNSAASYYNLGNIYFSTGRDEEAARFYKKTIELNPAFAPAYKNLAVICYEKGQYEASIRYYDKAIGCGMKIDPDFSRRLERFRRKSSD